MRLKILDTGHRLLDKALFAIIAAVTRQPVLDIVKLSRYRRDFYASQAMTQAAMRGPSAWSVCDRELMAAIVARTSECQWCTKAHAAVAEGACGDQARVAAVLDDVETAPIDAPLRATLLLLRKLTREHAIDADDVRAVLAAGVSHQQLEDALAVSFVFNITARLAETFGFAMATPAAFHSGAKYLLARGYQ